MYFVNHEQIEQRLSFIPEIAAAAERLRTAWESDRLLAAFAQERVLHLAIETVTDVGSLLIDAFVLRDASSYEDIMEILQGEQAFSAPVGESLIRLVKLRRPLVQDYISFERKTSHPMVAELPALLAEFADSVKHFIAKELTL
jgi:uncharacterized protein YutE (UPF0331/DUF86 family)